MKPFRFLPLTLLLLAFTAPLQAQTRTLPGNAHFLQQVTFPQIELNSATLAEAIELIREATRKVDPKGGGINIIIPSESEDIARPITVSLRNISGVDFLRLVLDITGLRLQVRGNLLWIVPHE